MEPKTNEEEKLNKLELDFEIQCKIVKATSKLCNEMNLKKSIKKQRKLVFQQAVAKLKDIEKNLQQTKKSIEEAAKRSKWKKEQINYDNNQLTNHRPITTNKQNSSYSLNEFSGDEEENAQQSKTKHTLDLFSKDLALITMSSAPSTPVKFRNKKFILVNENSNEHANVIVNRRINNNSPEYDTISSSSLGSANNVLFNNHNNKIINKKNNHRDLNNYEELIENSPETEAKKLFGVPTRRSAIAPNLSQDDSNLVRKQSSNLLLSLDRFTNERLKSLTRHNSLDKVRQQEFLKDLENNIDKINLRTQTDKIQSSNNLLSPNQPNLQTNQFNFSNLLTSNQLKNKSQINNNINMAQRPLPSPPIEHRKTLTANKQPPPLNLNNIPEHCVINNKNSCQGSSLIKNPIKSPSTASMFLQSPLDFEKAANLYLNKQRSISNLAQHQLNNNNTTSTNELNRLDTINEPLNIKPIRSTVVRTPALTINTCSSDLQHSPVPILPPRTPITSKPNLLNNHANSISNSNINYLNSYPVSSSNFAKSMISSNPNLNYSNLACSSQINKSTNNKPSKSWKETRIDTFIMPNSSNLVSSQQQNFYSTNQTNLINQSNKFNAFDQYHQQLKENENQFINHHSNLPSRPLINNVFNHQLVQENNSQSSLSSNSMLQSSNSSSILSNVSTQIFQPFIEETKPYQLSDFYKYSTKFNKNSQKNLQKKEINESSEKSIQNRQSLDKILTAQNDSSDNILMNSTAMMDESFFVKNQVAKEFTSELKDWLKEKYDKTATLV